MDSTDELHSAIRDRFPSAATMADDDYARRFGADGGVLMSLWFESLATAINREMRRDAPAASYRPLFGFFAATLGGCSPEVRACIDASFVENLFHDVAPGKAAPFWAVLPGPLRNLYTGFFGRTPL